jgi:hypothetical protein
MKKFSLFALVLVAVSVLLACNLSVPQIDAAMTYEQYKAAVVTEVSIDGHAEFIIDGDIWATSEDEVRASYDTYLSQLAGDRSSVNLITVNRKKVWDVYNATQRMNLTYTIDPAITTEIRNDLVFALGEWEKVAGVHFVNVTGTSVTPVFVLRNATAAEEAGADGVIASAFFPSYAKKELKLFDDFYELFSNGGTFYGWDSKAVLIHELGHGIGLRHEFIWSATKRGWRQTGETSAAAQLLTTARDDYSIMYYPQYSAYKGNGRISSGDVYGVTKLYPKN